MKSDPIEQFEPIRSRRLVRCVIVGCCVAVVWLIVLPWIARRPSFQSRSQWLEEKQIDPSAMYYTELDAMGPILKRLESRNRR